MHRLTIHSALTRQNKIRIRKMTVHIRCIQHRIDARLQFSAEKGNDTAAHTACRTGTGNGPDIDIIITVQNLRKIVQPGIQCRDIFLPRTFLRTVDHSCTVFSAQRIINITACRDLTGFQSFVHTGKIDGTDTNQIGAGRTQNRCAVMRIKPRTERRRHTASAVIGCGTAKSQQNLTDPKLQRRADHLTRSVC